jgi:hypothetical protein
MEFIVVRREDCKLYYADTDTWTGDVLKAVRLLQEETALSLSRFLTQATGSTTQIFYVDVVVSNVRS